MKNMKFILYGLATGIVNALFASGGGLIAVPAIRSLGHKQKNAQASALAIILVLSAVSVIVYYSKGYFNPAAAMKYIPFGFVGALLGTGLLKKANDNILRKIFSLFILWAGVRMIFR